ncbi:MAG: Uncharacterized protein G01um101477_540 [Candidatus Doudnabacteria bacterium Gr01-1014_77]|uniref:Uncharacterized protein n=1 Tax=Candidatus Doudnabacteria bacterium Gr01-1014_77 TaxID=2017133 RepID=A0A554JAH7_9BACT|nr:MAG: Uncharacterized protein G01um101477_540 [Candidatus Doudnabacteria bacterium Gr01-1014_77]
MLLYFHMGSIIVLNDTLQITKEQGFPLELDLEKHKLNPFKAEDFKGKIFEFKDKKGIRNYQQTPVRNFLVENREGKWIYWGLIHMLEINHDYSKLLTSGKFEIIYIYPPEDMQKAHDLIDRNPETRF